MQIRINCKIANLNSTTQPGLMIRKFFQIMFVDQKALTLYTATILGIKSRESEWFGRIPPDFSVKFEYSADESASSAISTEGSEGFVSLSIEHCNKTKEFINQIEVIKNIWGAECKVTDEQANKEKWLKDILKDSGIPTNPGLLAGDAKYLYVQEEKNNITSLLLKTLASEGSMEIEERVVKM